MYPKHHLYPAHLPGALHPAGHIDCVPPDVILRLASPDHPGHHGAPGNTNAEREHLTQESYFQRWSEN